MVSISVALESLGCDAYSAVATDAGGGVACGARELADGVPLSEPMETKLSSESELHIRGPPRGDLLGVAALRAIGVMELDVGHGLGERSRAVCDESTGFSAGDRCKSCWVLRSR